ncbi:MAG TPA: hypothetical protein VIM56_15280 [Rhizomicrobium sp.]
MTAGSVFAGVLLAALWCAPVFAQDAPQTVDDITKLKQDPVGGLKSVFLQDVTLPYGHGNANSFTVQPVWPIRLSGDWKMITYTIIPYQYVPAIGPGGTAGSGLGNILFNGYITPAKPSGTFKWGVGPALWFPTRTDPVLGSNAMSAGPSALIFDSFGELNGGFVVQNLWSLGGSGFNKVDEFSGQYFLNYNLPDGWSLESNATITANWLESSPNRWTVPIGGGVGKTFQIPGSDLFYAAGVQGLWNVAHPDGVGDWEVILQFQIIFGQ